MEGGRKAERIIFNSLAEYPESRDPILRYNWRDGDDMFVTVSGQNIMLLRDRSDKLIRSVCFTCFMQAVL